jgi:hypothetical protein
MRARFIKGDNPLDTMEIGRIDMRRKEKIFQTVQDIVAEYNLDPDTIKDQDKKRKGVQEVEFAGNNYYFYLGWLDHEQRWYFGVETDTNKNVEGQRSDKFDYDYAVEIIKTWVRKYGIAPDVSEAQHFTKQDNPLDSLDIGRAKERRMEFAKENIQSLMEQYFKVYGGDHGSMMGPYRTSKEVEDKYIAGFWTNKSHTEFSLGYFEEGRDFVVTMHQNNKSPIQYHRKTLPECLTILNKWLKNFA